MESEDVLRVMMLVAMAMSTERCAELDHSWTTAASEAQIQSRPSEAIDCIDGHAAPGRHTNPST